MLKYGIILSAGALKHWQLACIERLHHSKLADLRCVVNDAGTAGAGAHDQELLYAGVPSQQPADAREIANFAPQARRYDLALRAGEPLPPQDADFFLLFGDEQSGAALASAARYGVWYFAHGDLSCFSTCAPGFWEVHGDREVTGAYLMCLQTGSAGVPLKDGYLPTIRTSFEENAEAVLRAIAMWPQHVCWDITHGAAAYFGSAPRPRPPAHFGFPSSADIARMRKRERRRRTAALLTRHFFSIEWTVGIVREAPAQFIGGDRRATVAYLYDASKTRYLADPCVVAHDSRAYLFCEEYRARNNLGAVVVSELVERGATPPRVAIEETHHLSYPHVFDYDGRTYCIPESGGIRKVCLYRCVEFPHRWEFVRTLIDGFEAADGTVVRHDGRWWLFCTSSEAVPKGYYSHLYVWHADDLFGTWTQHVRNPVKIDARSSRPAGPFFTHAGLLYRPAQDCSRSYGCAVRINRIDVLTRTEFQETVVGTIRPPRSRYTRGLHTLSAANGCCVVDVERYAFNLSNARYALTQTAKRALVRMGMPEHVIARIKQRLFE